MGKGRNQQAPDSEGDEASEASPSVASQKTDFCRKVGVSVSDDNNCQNSKMVGLEGLEPPTKRL